MRGGPSIKSLRAAEQDRPDVADRRRHWRVWQRYMDPARFVFLDETGASTNMVRRYGWGPRGERLADAAPHGHWRTTTFVAGLRSTGFVAPLVLDGPMTGEAFRAYVEQFLAPALEAGDVVVLDNLAAHQVAGVREAIHAANASLMLLPAYSPDLNPIEQAFAKLKAGLRKVGARTRETLWATIGRLLETFSPDECRNYLANSEPIRKGIESPESDVIRCPIGRFSGAGRWHGQRSIGARRIGAGCATPLT